MPKYLKRAILFILQHCEIQLKWVWVLSTAITNQDFHMFVKGKNSGCSTAAGSVTINKEKMNHSKNKWGHAQIKAALSVLIHCEPMCAREDQLTETVKINLLLRLSPLTPTRKCAPFKSVDLCSGVRVQMLSLLWRNKLATLVGWLVPKCSPST